MKHVMMINAVFSIVQMKEWGISCSPKKFLFSFYPPRQGLITRKYSQHVTLTKTRTRSRLPQGGLTPYLRPKYDHFGMYACSGSIPYGSLTSTLDCNRHLVGKQRTVVVEDLYVLRYFREKLI